MMHFPFVPATSLTVDPDSLERDLQDARQIETIYLGQQCLYYPGMLKLRYLPYDQIQWAYLRAEENRMSMCCGKTFVDIWYLLLYAEGRQIAKIEFQKKETAKAALTALTESHEHMLVGYSEENRERFAAQNH